MKTFVLIMFIFTWMTYSQASQYQYAKVYNQKLTPDDSKIKSCLSGLYASQIKYRKAKGYFATLPDELNLTKYAVCDGLEISTHFVSDSKFRMRAKFNHRIWSVDETKNIKQQQE